MKLFDPKRSLDIEFYIPIKLFRVTPPSQPPNGNLNSGLQFWSAN